MCHFLYCLSAGFYHIKSSTHQSQNVVSERSEREWHVDLAIAIKAQQKWQSIDHKAFCLVSELFGVVLLSSAYLKVRLRFDERTSSMKSTS